MHDVNVGAADRFIIDFAPLATGVGAADRCDVGAFFHPMTIKHRIPCSRGGLDEVRALDRVFRRFGSPDMPAQPGAHGLGKLTAMLLVGTVNFDLLEAEQTAEKFQVGAGLPTTSK